MAERSGKIEECKSYEEKEIEWKIPEISSISKSGKSYYDSPVISFKDNSWYFRLWPKSPQKPGYMIMYHCYEKLNEYSVEYDCGVKKQDNTVENLGRGILGRGQATLDDPCFVLDLTDFEQRKSELAPSDVLTLTFKLKHGKTVSPETTVVDTTNLKKLIKLDTLSDNFKDLLTNKESCDLTLNVKDKEYKVHRAVLIARSSIFASMFRNDTKKKQFKHLIQNNLTNITIPDCDPEYFGMFLEFLYCGKLEDVSFSSALHLYEISSKYDIQELKTFCMEYLTENFTTENLCDALILADKHNDVKLSSAAQNFFNKTSNKIFQTSGWECLMKSNCVLTSKLLKEMPKMTATE